MPSNVNYTAADFLGSAVAVMQERGKQYDKPEGERSMGKVIAAFNAITGHTLTESEGWLMMCLLKMVRQWQNPQKAHEDSLLDGVAYAALLAESVMCSTATPSGIMDSTTGEQHVKRPTWLKAAYSQIGVREIPGPANSRGVMAMVERAKGWLGISVTQDSTPWCGTFVASCMAAAGFRPPRGAIGVRAKWWATWGDSVSTTATRPPLGAIAVFNRAGGGHVGFVVAVHDNGDFDILGGNQGDAVNIRRFPRSRLVALRWPSGVPHAETAPWAKGKTAETSGEA